MAESDKYDLTGVRGAENFRELESGLLLELTDGARGRITENAGNGAVVFVTVVEDPNNADAVGEERVVLFNEVERVVEDGA